MGGETKSGVGIVPADRNDWGFRVEKKDIKAGSMGRRRVQNVC